MHWYLQKLECLRRGVILVGWGLHCKWYVGVMGIKRVRNCWVYSALWTTRVPSMYLSQIWGWGGAHGFGFEVFHEEVGHHRADGRLHSSPLYLFIILTLDHEEGTF